LLYQFPLLLVNFLFGNTCDYNNTWTVGVHSSSWFAISLLTINFIYLPYLFLNTLQTHTHTHIKWKKITSQKKYKYVDFKRQQRSNWRAWFTTNLRMLQSIPGTNNSKVF
jgi:hypothetical protein